MKYIKFLIMAIMPVGAFAAAPSTSCPSGYITIVEEYMTISDTSCPGGYVSVGVADSCLVSSPSGSCIMYAPANTQYTDLLGIYNFTAACPLE